MQVKCGTDIIRIERVAQAVRRQGKPFLDRIWTADEQADCLPANRRTKASDALQPAGMTTVEAASLAARFAAKEAVAKALGTGIGPLGVSWTDIVICRQPGCDPADQATGPDGDSPAMRLAPQVLLLGGALRRYQQMGGQSICISLTHDGGLAMAYCVLLHDSTAVNQAGDVSATTGLGRTL